MIFKAKISGAHNTLTGNTLHIPYRYTQLIGTGVKVEIPDGYKLVLRTTSHFTQKGLIAFGEVTDLYASGDVLVWVQNIGREFVVLNSGDDFVEARLEKIQDFDVEVLE